jgi:hypothetical protein
LTALAALCPLAESGQIYLLPRNGEFA